MNKIALRKKTAVAIFMSLVLLLCSCNPAAGGGGSQANPPSGTGTDPGSGGDWARGKALPSGDIDYVLLNNLSVSEESEVITGSHGDTYVYYPVIYGLKDKTIQESINKRIYGMVAEMSSPLYLPAVQDSGMLEREGLELTEFTQKNVMGTITASAGNMLSVMVSCYIVFHKAGTDEYAHMSSCETINVDLNTGKDINITDMLSDDVDALKYISDAIKSGKTQSGHHDEGMVTDIESLKFNDEFTGIKENQKYFVDQYDGSIVLILDTATPEFETGSQFIPARIPVENHRGLNRFVLEGESIYEDETPCYGLLNTHLEYLPENLVYSDNIRREVHCAEYYSHRTYENLSKEQNEFLVISDEEKVEASNFAEQLYANYSRVYGEESLEITSSIDSFASCYGNYLSLVKSWNASAWNTVTHTNVYNNYYRSCRNTLFDSGKPVQVQDLFRDKEGWKELVADTLVKDLRTQWPDVYGLHDTASLKELALAVLEHCESFDLEQQNISFYYNLPENFISRYPKFADNFEPYHFQDIFYKDLGCENLTIFGD